MKIVVLDGYTINPGDLSWSRVERMGSCTIYDRTREEEIVERAAGAELILTNKVPLSKEIIDQLPKLEYIGVLATGFDKIDIGYAAAKGIPVCNASGYSTDSVAQHVFALLLELVHQTGNHTRSVHKGDWSNQNDFSYSLKPIRELKGKTLGLIGYGKIGQRVAEIARVFGMKLLVHRKNTGEDPGPDTTYAELEELASASDVVSLHCPLNSETKGIVGKEFMEKMKSSAYIINTGRGPLIDEAHLAKMIKEEKLAGAGLDVMSQEPPPVDHPLLGVENCIITPHQAWASFESRERLMDITADNLRAWMMGDTENQVN